jgi:RNA polymerase sigma-70 factor (ECF subfamily)
VSTLALQQRLPGSAQAALRGGVVTEVAGESALTDTGLMLRAQAGDDSAFNQLVEKFRRPLIGFMYRMAGNQSVAEELAQEVFLRVYRSRATYAAEAKFSTWLYRIAKNLALNHIRDTRNERAQVAASLDEPDEESGRAMDAPDPHRSAEEEMVRRERMQAIRREVESLPERQRMAVILHKYQELDYREIARTLKMSESATKSLLFRAYETLRVKLKDFV